MKRPLSIRTRVSASLSGAQFSVPERCQKLESWRNVISSEISYMYVIIKNFTTMSKSASLSLSLIMFGPLLF